MTAATPRPIEGAISWNINTSCNYRCDYCTQRFKDNRGRWSEDTGGFLRAFASLPGQWEVKISGGEPFLHPRLLELVAGLARLGHRISVVTNFSAEREALRAFVAAAGGRVGVFSCSLHLDYVRDLRSFVEKLRWLEQELRLHADPDQPEPKVNVTSVATRRALPMLPGIAESFGRADIRFKVQPEKQDRETIRYTAEEERVILSLGGHNRTGKIVHRFQGRPCWAGSRYFILDDLGQAYRCYPARRYKIERMGSFLAAGFKLEEQPRPCAYETCNCTVPIARGMVPLDPHGEKDRT